ncbi:uncharacterized protein LOC120354478 [Nilaparvata lugens]|uniref:uncharacterized protein LOC120354478 n=1 Tax=Nilaparvata lugens TaxID=108931 RepID=UPI00193CD6FB|nr:uncharacterized protein LOC120354478 [Nilaparvata lugens]
MLMTIQSQMAENKTESNANFASLQSTLATLKTSFDGLEKKLTRVENDNSVLKSRCSQLEEANLKLTKEICELKWVTMESEQYSKLRNIEIQGIPEKEGEDIYQLLSAISKILKVTYQPCEILIAHRLAPSRNNSPSTIVVSFVRRSVRAEWLKAARMIKIKASDVMTSFRATPVYVNEHLTKRNKELLKQAKNSVKAGDEKYAWVREGKVYVRKTADARARRLYWPNDDQPPTAAAPAAARKSTQ